ncbi:hypothetical protein [Pedococcus bigeumensis]|uniref:hypothetical protein n=1 Tax=Pedococcus bigeumensis TaxID=433644 RepID=UPI002FEB721F
MTRTTLTERNAKTGQASDLGEFLTWDEALEVIRQRCDGRLPEGDGVATSDTPYPWATVRRAMIFKYAEYEYRVTTLDESH